MERCRIVFSGSGGQGIITAAIILAEAAVLHEDLNAIQAQSYGPEARGGATRSDVIISEDEIHYPKVIQPNILVCLTQTAYNKYVGILRPGGILLTDPHFVQVHRQIDALRREVPMYEAVMDQIGKPIVFNICMLGALLGINQMVEPDAIMKILEDRIPEHFLEMNRQALNIGIELGKANGH